MPKALPPGKVKRFIGTLSVSVLAGSMGSRRAMGFETARFARLLSLRV
jgi:hypothetical protein